MLLVTQNRGDLALGLVNCFAEPRVDVGVEQAVQTVPLHPEIGASLGSLHRLPEVDVFFPRLKRNPILSVTSRALDCFADHVLTWAWI